MGARRRSVDSSRSPRFVGRRGGDGGSPPGSRCCRSRRSRRRRTSDRGRGCGMPACRRHRVGKWRPPRGVPARRLRSHGHRAGQPGRSGGDRRDGSRVRPRRSRLVKAEDPHLREGEDPPSSPRCRAGWTGRAGGTRATCRRLCRGHEVDCGIFGCVRRARLGDSGKMRGGTPTSAGRQPLRGDNHCGERSTHGTVLGDTFRLRPCCA